MLNNNRNIQAEYFRTIVIMYEFFALGLSISFPICCNLQFELNGIDTASRLVHMLLIKTTLELNTKDLQVSFLENY